MVSSSSRIELSKQRQKWLVSNQDSTNHKGLLDVAVVGFMSAGVGHDVDKFCASNLLVGLQCELFFCAFGKVFSLPTMPNDVVQCLAKTAE